MAINTLVTLRDEIQRFVDGHGQIKRVIFEADDHRSAYITEGDEFPVMFVAPIDVIEGASMSTHRLRVYVYERINHGREDVWENANDTSLMLRDLRVWFNSYYDGDINIIEDPNAEFLSDRELDKLVGYFSDFQFELPSHGRCDVPVNITPLPPAPTCLDARVINTDLTYDEDVASGGTLTLPDITVTDSDGSTLTVPAMTDVVCSPAPDATVKITNSDNDLLGSVVVPSGGVDTFEVPDEDITVNGNLLVTKPSAQDYNVEVVDSLNNPIGVVSGGKVVVSELPCVPNPIGGSAMHLQTGQTTSYADDDDGDTRRGRPLFTLPIIGSIQQLNHFGNKWRFTGITGGYYDRDTSTYRLVDGTPTTRAGAYPNDLRCDWSTLDWNGDFLLWQMDNTLITGDWNYCVEQANLLNVGGFSNFYLPNEEEYFSIRQVEEYPVFITKETINGAGGFALWSSTTDIYYKTHATAFYNDGRITAVDKIASINSLQVRITNINEL